MTDLAFGSNSTGKWPPLSLWSSARRPPTATPKKPPAAFVRKPRRDTLPQGKILLLIICSSPDVNKLIQIEEQPSNALHPFRIIADVCKCLVLLPGTGGAAEDDLISQIHSR